MYTWVIYDIVKDGARQKVARRCKQYGLRRVQKSVFLGKLRRRHLKPLRRDLIRLVNLRTDVVFILRIDKQQYRRLVRIGKRKPAGVAIEGGEVFLF